jgi:hypothetical protein
MKRKIFLIHTHDTADFVAQLIACLACEGINAQAAEVIPWTGREVISWTGMAAVPETPEPGYDNYYISIIVSSGLDRDALVAIYLNYIALQAYKGNVNVSRLDSSSIPALCLDSPILDFRDWQDKKTTGEYNKTLFRLIRLLKDSADERDRREVQQRGNRRYESTLLPTLRQDAKVPTREDVLLKLYTEVSSGWRLLTDVRFKLLALVPAVSAVALVAILPKDIVAAATGASGGTAATTWGAGRALIALFGLLITVGLALYDRRNSELYNDLISRGRKIEEELGIDTAIFRGRMNPVNSYQTHSVATKMVYLTTEFGWFVALTLIAVETIVRP